MKKPAAIRLAEAINALLVQIHSYCKTHINEDPRLGICVATPKTASPPIPSPDFAENILVGTYLKIF